MKDMIAQRHDGRRLHAEPLDAFADELGRLSHGAFRFWWSQIVSKFCQANPQTSYRSILRIAVDAGLVPEITRPACHTAMALLLWRFPTRGTEG